MRRAAIALAALLSFAQPAAADTPYTIVCSFPHDTAAFTEGLFFRDGDLFESTGMPGKSDIRRVRVKDGKVIARQTIPARQFGEGIVDWGDQIISVTWRDGVGHRWSAKDLKPLGSFTYSGEGWGMTRDAQGIILSDGTDVLRRIDPATFREVGRIRVTWQGAPVVNINELEYVRGEILANIWMSDRIARIDPVTGKVKDWIDLGPIARQMNGPDPDSVANGIAYDAATDRIFVTGKYWSKVWVIRVR